MHPIHLEKERNLQINFSLKINGKINPLIHPFFENLNPGFKIYIGDYKVFDYVMNGILDNVSWTLTSEKA